MWRWFGTLAAALGFVAWSAPLLAQEEDEYPAAASQRSAAETPRRQPDRCFPACRQGFVCYQGQCISSCNPPCPAGQICVQGRRCEPDPAQSAGSAGIYEPPPPPPPRETPFAQRAHTLLAFHMGLGGVVEIDDDEGDLNTTYGVNLRADIPVVQYLVLGPLIQFGTWQQDSAVDLTRDYYFDLDLYLSLRVPVELEKTALQFWGGVPVGLTLNFLGEDRTAAGLAGFAAGWNIGALFGGAVHFTRQFGLFGEIGWLQHKMSHNYRNVRADVDFRLSQLIINLGFVFGK